MDGWKPIYFEVHSEVRRSFQKRGMRLLPKLSLFAEWIHDVAEDGIWQLCSKFAWFFHQFDVLNGIWAKAKGKGFFVYQPGSGVPGFWHLSQKTKRTGRKLKNLWWSCTISSLKKTQLHPMRVFPRQDAPWVFDPITEENQSQGNVPRFELLPRKPALLTRCGTPEVLKRVFSKQKTWLTLLGNGGNEFSSIMYRLYSFIFSFPTNQPRNI